MSYLNPHERAKELKPESNMKVTADQQRTLATTYRGAARELEVCERVVWQLVKTGKLKAIRIGRSVRIPRAELERFIAERTAPEGGAA